MAGGANVSVNVRIGTSGYSYAEWKGNFYPEKMAAKEMLRYYSERFPTVAQARKMSAMHDALLKNSLSFISLLESEELRCDLASLGYFSHWQTPSQVSQPFDTRFFVAALPPEQIPLESSYEVTHSLWLAPERAMQLHERGQLPMIFPTFVSLRTLADFETLESVLKEFHAGTVTPVSSKPSTLTKQ
jgi:hypothetical protein